MVAQKRNMVARARNVGQRMKQSDTLTAVVSTVVKAGSDPRLVMVLGLILIVAVTHVDPAKGFVQDVADWLAKREGTKALGEYISGHLLQTVGALVYTVVTFTLARRPEMGMWLLLSVAAAYLLPAKTSYQYLAHAALLAIYLRANRKDVKIAIVAASVALWALGYIA